LNRNLYRKSDCNIDRPHLKQKLIVEIVAILLRGDAYKYTAQIRSSGLKAIGLASWNNRPLFKKTGSGISTSCLFE
jgi:hypothetical protein